MKNSIIFLLFAMVFLISCQENNGIYSNFQYQAADSTVFISQSSQIVLQYQGQDISTKVNLDLTQEWADLGKEIQVNVIPTRIRMTQGSPFFGEMTFDSDAELVKEGMSEEQIALQEEVRKALELRNTFLISKNETMQTKGMDTESDFTVNPFQFLIIPEGMKKGDEWVKQFPLNYNIPSFANITFTVNTQEDEVSTITFEGVLSKDKDSEMTKILGLIDLDGTITGEIQFDHEKHRIINGFARTKGVCDLLQMNTPLSMNYSIDQQFTEKQ